ncbi:hypothetical protein [Microbacterium sp. Se63.02b]|uniref:hypothetical protein n=1 Tax=Microbacterium sp. Se63.02b TaxID=2709304 RepID=UPI001FCF1256|nr:hypothetical protein [Microbacterium sp. Se63.02b]
MLRNRSAKVDLDMALIAARRSTVQSRPGSSRMASTTRSRNGSVDSEGQPVGAHPFAAHARMTDSSTVVAIMRQMMGSPWRAGFWGVIDDAHVQGEGGSRRLDRVEAGDGEERRQQGGQRRRGIGELDVGDHEARVVAGFEHERRSAEREEGVAGDERVVPGQGVERETPRPRVDVEMAALAERRMPDHAAVHDVDQGDGVGGDRQQPSRRQ